MGGINIKNTDGDMKLKRVAEKFIFLFISLCVFAGMSNSVMARNLEPRYWYYIVPDRKPKIPNKYAVT
jgi:hypothetical protein